MVKYDITTADRIRHFLAQCTVESGGTTDLLEDDGDNTDYAPYYGAGRIHITLESGYKAFAIYEALEKYPELADYGITYYNPQNRGPEYIDPEYEELLEVAKKLGLNISEFTDIVDIGPTYVAEHYPWESAGYFWNTSGCNEAVDGFKEIKEENADDITRIVNSDNDPNKDKKRETYRQLMEYIQ